jgi:hypothetical protein
LGFTGRRAAASFEEENLDNVQADMNGILRNSENWAFSNVSIEDTEYIPSEGEVEPYVVERRAFEWVVMDNTRGDGVFIIFGPATKFQCEKVAELLDNIYSGKYVGEMMNDGDPDDLPF